MKFFRFFAATCAVGAIAMAGGPGPAQAEQPQLLMAVTVDDLPVAQPSWHTHTAKPRYQTRELHSLNGPGLRKMDLSQMGYLCVHGSHA